MGVGSRSSSGDTSLSSRLLAHNSSSHLPKATASMWLPPLPTIPPRVTWYDMHRKPVQPLQLHLSCQRDPGTSTLGHPQPMPTSAPAMPWPISASAPSHQSHRGKEGPPDTLAQACFSSSDSAWVLSMCSVPPHTLPSASNLAIMAQLGNNPGSPGLQLRPCHQSAMAHFCHGPARALLPG